MSFYEDRIFPVALDIALAGIADTRRELIQSAQGRVLEVGIGNGANLRYYTDRATEVVGVEPCAAMVDMAQKKVDKLIADSEGKISRDKYQLKVGGGENLDLEDNSVDTAVACLVFCTIPDAEGAAKEMFRVLKPGGKMLFFEHVHAAPGIKARVQNLLNPIWKPLACGCHLNRNTKHMFEQAGFNYQQIEEYHHSKMFPIFSSVIEGIAVKPG
ncbi:MAG TPA: SAM-dependent methyltransferase [Gammaproteobacteria bacterium]|nr:SAM-dependent methyltransferase [Gammaproteobacteria bacterium]